MLRPTENVEIELPINIKITPDQKQSIIKICCATLFNIVPIYVKKQKMMIFFDTSTNKITYNNVCIDIRKKCSNIKRYDKNVCSVSLLNFINNNVKIKMKKSEEKYDYNPRFNVKLRNALIPMLVFCNNKLYQAEIYEI